MTDINTDKASTILKNLQNTNENYVTNENGINKEFKKDASTSIFSQKNLYQKLGVTSDEQYKQFLGTYDGNGDGILDVNEAKNLAGSIQKGEVTDSNKKSLLSKVLSFVVGAVTAQCSSMSNIRKIDSDNSILATDTRGNLKGEPDKVIELGEKALNSEAWDGTDDNFDYLQYSGYDSASVSSAINNAANDGKITQDEINNNTVLSKLFRERDLTNDNNKADYGNISEGYNSAYYLIDSDGNGEISKNELTNFINNKANDDVKKALGSIDTSNTTGVPAVDTNSVQLPSVSYPKSSSDSLMKIADTPIKLPSTSNYSSSKALEKYIESVKDLPSTENHSKNKLKLGEWPATSTVPDAENHSKNKLELGEWPATSTVPDVENEGSYPDQQEYPYTQQKNVSNIINNITTN